MQNLIFFFFKCELRWSPCQLSEYAGLCNQGNKSDFQNKERLGTTVQRENMGKCYFPMF